MIPATFAKVGDLPVVASDAALAAIPAAGGAPEALATMVAEVARAVRGGLALSIDKAIPVTIAGVELAARITLIHTGPTAAIGVVTMRLPTEEGPFVLHAAGEPPEGGYLQ